MDKGDSSGMEGNASVRVGARRSVFKVALDRASEVRELAADLVVTTCQEFHFHQMIPVSPADLSVVQFRKFRILASSSRTSGGIS